ncbi:hypothetical protein, partial [Burkholderia sp. PU8-34]
GNWTVQTRVVNEGGMLGPVKMYDVELDVASPNAPSSATRSGNAIDVTLAGTGATVGDMINVMIGDHRITYTLTGADVASGRAKVTIPASIAATMDEHASYGAALVDKSGNVSEYLITRFVEIGTGERTGSGIVYTVTDFNHEKPRDIAGGAPIDFGVFTAVLGKTTPVGGLKIDQGIRVKGGSGSDANEVGLVFGIQEVPRFYLNNGAHAQAVSFDLDSRSGYVLMARFFDDAGNLIFNQYLYSTDRDSQIVTGLHSYQIVLPDGMQFSSFNIGWYVDKNGGGGTGPNMLVSAWIDNIGFSGGSFGGLVPEVSVDFNHEKLRDIDGGEPIDFGVFTAVLGKTTSVGGLKIDQGIRVKGGGGSDANEVGLLFGIQELPRFYLNNGAHAQAVNFDLDNRTANVLMARFFDDAGNLIFKQYLYNSDLGSPGARGAHSYQIVLPDGIQFSSFNIGWYYDNGNGGTMPSNPGSVWIDNIGFSGGSFSKSSWEAITELVPPAD